MAEQTPEELKQQKLDALKASVLSPYTGQLSAPSPLPAAPAPVVKTVMPKTKTPGSPYDARKALMDKALARYLPRTA